MSTLLISDPVLVDAESSSSSSESELAASVAASTAGQAVGSLASPVPAPRVSGALSGYRSLTVAGLNNLRDAASQVPLAIQTILGGFGAADKSLAVALP